MNLKIWHKRGCLCRERRKKLFRICLYKQNSDRKEIKVILEYPKAKNFENFFEKNLKIYDNQRK